MNNIDLAIIGGGPAGLIANFWAKRQGLKSLIIEKNKLGSKILVSGNGRCNFTNQTSNLRNLVSNYQNGEFLYRAFSEFGPEETIHFFEESGIKVKNENSKVFPASDRAEDILEVFESEVGNVIEGKAVEFKTENKKVVNVIVETSEGIEKIKARNFLLAAGGSSYPHLGSDGSGFNLARSLNHKIIGPTPGLVPIKCDDERATNLRGINLEDVEVSTKKEKERGDLIFTHFGFSGPVILNLSLRLPRKINQLKINLFPSCNREKVDQKLQEIFKENKNLKNCLSILFPKRFVEVIFSEFDLEKKGNKVTREERKSILNKITNLTFENCRLLGFEYALVTRGGVDLKEICSNTMGSKKYDNLFFAGEIINVVGRTGGFNMQMCWSSGRLAAKSAFELDC